MNSEYSIRPHHRMAESIRNNRPILLSDLFIKFPEYIENEMHDGWLHYSAREGSLQAIEFLLEYGFDINKKESFNGINPLTSACSGGHLEIVEYLLDHGAKWDVSKSVRNPLFAVIVESIKGTMNQTFGPPTGEAPEIVRLLLERGIDSKVRYNSKRMKNIDAVAFAMMMGAREIAHIIALWNADGDEKAAQAALAEGLDIAYANTKAVPPGEQIAPS